MRLALQPQPLMVGAYASSGFLLRPRKGHLLPQRGGGYRNDFIIQQQQQQQQQLQQHAAMAGGDEDGDVSVSSGGSVGGLSAESGYSFHARDKQVGGGLVGD